MALLDTKCLNWANKCLMDNYTLCQPKLLQVQLNIELRPGAGQILIYLN